MPPQWVVVALTVVCSATGGPSAVAAAARASSEDVRVPVGVRTRAFVDRSRSTPADVPAGITPADERRLETRLYYPARGDALGDGGPIVDAEPRRGPFPLVLFSPGAPGIPKDYEPLLLDVAAAKYVVAAVTFPVSSVAGPDDAAWRDLPAQSADARFVLGGVLGLDPAKAGIPKVDHHRVASMGHSFGGATTLSLVSPCCRDRRVDVAVVLASVIRTVHGPTLRAPSGPVLFVHARRDGAVPYARAAALCTRVRGPRRLLTMEAIRGLGAHVDPYVGDGAHATIVRPAVVAFLNGHLRERSSARTQLDEAGNGSRLATVTRCRS